MIVSSFHWYYSEDAFYEVVLVVATAFQRVLTMNYFLVQVLCVHVCMVEDAATAAALVEPIELC